MPTGSVQNQNDMPIHPDVLAREPQAMVCLVGLDRWSQQG